MRRSRHLAAVLTVAILVAACQGAATQAPVGTGSATGSLRPSSAATQPAQPSNGSTAATGTAVPSFAPSFAPTAAATQGPGGGTPAASGSAAPTVAFHAAPELERSVPTQAGGLPLTVESVTGAGFADTAGNHKAGLRCRWYDGRGLRCRDQKELAATLAVLGKSLQDVSIAVSYNETKNREIEVQATRVAGVRGAELRDATLAVLKDAASKQKETLNAAPGTVGGKSVIVITYASPYPLGLRRYLYAAGDLLYDVRRAYDAPAAEILAGLP